jgi:hypothetical protein
MDSTHIMKLSSVGYLRLAYVATEITLHRRIILALSPSTDSQLFQICRSVAHERFIFAIDFVQSLKPQHVSSFWYFVSAQNFALIGVFGTLLLSTASDDQEETFYRTKLKEYRWILKMNSENGARYMKPAMTLLDANMALLTEAKISTPSTSSNTLGHPNVRNRSHIDMQGHSDDYLFSEAQLPVGGEFTSPSQYLYPELNSAEDSAATFSPLTDAQFQEFGAGMGSGSGQWSY